MESQPQNPELRNNPENFHPCSCAGIFNSLHAGQFFMLLLSSADFFKK